MKMRTKQPVKAKKPYATDTLSKTAVKSVYNKTIDSSFRQFQKVFEMLGKSSQLRDV